MNEFEWRRQMRDLRQPLTPQRDLWVSIEAALEDSERTPVTPVTRAPRPAYRRWMIATGIAASLLLTGGIGWQVLHAPAATSVASSKGSAGSWKPADPRLAGAAIELNAAQMELQLAIKQAPGSPSLQRLLSRAEQQQTQLRQLASQAAG